MPSAHDASDFGEAGLRHDVVAALAAVDAAVRAIRAGAPGRDELCQAISAEIDSVRRLLEPATEPDRRRLVLADELEPLVALARAEGMLVTVTVDEALVAAGDRSGLHRVVRNLLDNARAHAPGTPVDISAEAVGRNIQLRVEDRGPGVAAEDRERIFAPWHRGRYRRNRRASDMAGRGLGLAVATELVERMGGRLWVENRPGGGSSFVLTLPAADRYLRVIHDD